MVEVLHDFVPMKGQEFFGLLYDNWQQIL